MKGYVLLGSPGAGKGTIGQFLHETYGIDHFSSGDILRNEVNTKTAIGRKIKPIMSEGGQVSDDLITELVLKCIQDLVASDKSFVLDGFPQTLPQQEKLTLFSNKYHFDIRYICVTVKRSIALDRMIHRITCSVCDTIFRKKQETTENCMKCNGKLFTRKSDRLDLANERLNVFDQTTLQVMDHVERHFNPMIINGNNSIDSIQSYLIHSIKPLCKL